MVKDNYNYSSPKNKLLNINLYIFITKYIDFIGVFGDIRIYTSYAPYHSSSLIFNIRDEKQKEFFHRILRNMFIVVITIKIIIY